MNMKNKQRGAMSAELLMYVGFAVVGLLFVATQAPKVIYKVNEMRFTSQAAEIAQATHAWKKGRPNFDGVTIQKVCAEGDLSKTICGTANNGVETNSFGGNWTVSVNAASKGLFDTTATIPNDASRIPALANSLAPTTRAGCLEASGCSTISTTANSLKMTY